MTQNITARCHCGAVTLKAQLKYANVDAARCTCSFCKRRQAAAVTAITATVEITKGAENLSCYSWHTHTAKHYFCKTCGIYTHHQRRSDPAESGINLGCIDGENPWDHDPIRWTDGANHPSDS
ncbi:MAG: GFA family protein [Sulfitobacter sp.]